MIFVLLCSVVRVFVMNCLVVCIFLILVGVCSLIIGCFFVFFIFFDYWVLVCCVFLVNIVLVVV